MQVFGWSSAFCRIGVGVVSKAVDVFSCRLPATGGCDV